MDRYMMTTEGRAKFRRTRATVDKAEMTEGHKILDYLFEHGADTIDEIGTSTGLSRDQVVAQLQVFMNHGFVEEMD